jgi:hypothetical protein
MTTKKKKTVKGSNYTKKELDEITADRKYWQSYGDLVGARLYGWTYRRNATFIMPNGSTLPLDQNHIKWAEALIKKTADTTCKMLVNYCKATTKEKK